MKKSLILSTTVAILLSACAVNSPKNNKANVTSHVVANYNTTSYYKYQIDKYIKGNDYYQNYIHENEMVSNLMLKLANSLNDIYSVDKRQSIIDIIDSVEHLTQISHNAYREIHLVFSIVFDWNDKSKEQDVYDNHFIYRLGTHNYNKYKNFFKNIDWNYYLKERIISKASYNILKNAI